jgi:hypothetical protein
MVLVWKKLLILMSVVSGVMCIGVMVLWVRSYMVSDVVTLEESNTGQWFLGLVLRSEGGRLTIEGEPWPDRYFHLRFLLFRSDLFLRGSASLPPYGFHQEEYLSNGASRYWYILTLPHWLYVVAFGAVTSLHLTQAMRRRCQQRAGLCRVCGYDLRATPDRCPECGEIVAQVAKVAST